MKLRFSQPHWELSSPSPEGSSSLKSPYGQTSSEFRLCPSGICLKRKALLSPWSPLISRKKLKIVGEYEYSLHAHHVHLTPHPPPFSSQRSGYILNEWVNRYCLWPESIDVQNISLVKLPSAPEGCICWKMLPSHLHRSEKWSFGILQPTLRKSVLGHWSACFTRAALDNIFWIVFWIILPHRLTNFHDR